MTRIHPLSDLHNEFEIFEAKLVDAHVTILAGDTFTRSRLCPWNNAREVFGGHPVIAIAGNHEFYSKCIDTEIDNLKELAIGKGINFLENEEIVYAGARFLGCTLWADFRLFAGDDLNKIKTDAYHCVGERHGNRNNDFWRIKVKQGNYRKFRPLDSAILHDRSVRWLESKLKEQFDGHTVIVTHHLPSQKCLPLKLRYDRMSASDASNLDWLIEKYQPAMWIYGHKHEIVEPFKIGNTLMISNPRGYAPNFLNPCFNSDLVIEL